MTFQELTTKLAEYPIFTFSDILKFFPEVHSKTLEVQIHKWVDLGYLERIRKGLYVFSSFKLDDPFILADRIYFPSYISLETALNYYSIIPDVPFSVTSVTNKKTAEFTSKRFGRFSYRHLKPELFLGFTAVETGTYSYHIAHPEKAVFDSLYLNHKIFDIGTFPKEERFDFPRNFRWGQVQKYCKLVSQKNKKFHILKDLLFKHHA